MDKLRLKSDYLKRLNALLTPCARAGSDNTTKDSVAATLMEGDRQAVKSIKTNTTEDSVAGTLMEGDRQAVKSIKTNTTVSIPVETMQESNRLGEKSIMPNAGDGAMQKEQKTMEMGKLHIAYDNQNKLQTPQSAATDGDNTADMSDSMELRMMVDREFASGKWDSIWELLGPEQQKRLAKDIVLTLRIHQRLSKMNQQASNESARGEDNKGASVKSVNEHDEESVGETAHADTPVNELDKSAVESDMKNNDENCDADVDNTLACKDEQVGGELTDDDIKMEIREAKSQLGADVKQDAEHDMDSEPAPIACNDDGVKRPMIEAANIEMKDVESMKVEVARMEGIEDAMPLAIEGADIKMKKVESMKYEAIGTEYMSGDYMPAIKAAGINVKMTVTKEADIKMKAVESANRKRKRPSPTKCAGEAYKDVKAKSEAGGAYRAEKVESAHPPHPYVFHRTSCPLTCKFGGENSQERAIAEFTPHDRDKGDMRDEVPHALLPTADVEARKLMMDEEDEAHDKGLGEVSLCKDDRRDKGMKMIKEMTRVTEFEWDAWRGIDDEGRMKPAIEAADIKTKEIESMKTEAEAEHEDKSLHPATVMLAKLAKKKDGKSRAKLKSTDDSKPKVKMKMRYMQDRETRPREISMRLYVDRIVNRFELQGAKFDHAG